jgi:cell wall assembly regulator SMI1
MEKWIGEVVSKWNAEGVKLNPAVTVADIEKAELILDFKLPEGFKALYLVFNGFSDWGWQEHFFSLWPLERIVEEYTISEDKSYIVFCDYLMYSHSIGFMKDETGVFKSYGHPNR